MTLAFQPDIETSPLPGWRGDCASELLETLRPPSQFPCVFSQNACQRRRIVFSFVEGLDDASLAGAADDLAAYLRRADAWDGQVATAEPLAVLFSPETVRDSTVAGYHAIGWRILQYWHDHDPHPWPDGVSRDPHQPFWAMCYRGIQLFVNMSAPAHAVRRSRNLGRAFTFIINPRERFDIVAGDDPRGRRVRATIRDRIAAYDGVGHSPQLGSYEAGEIEWWQYGLAETNAPRTDACPFRLRPAA